MKFTREPATREASEPFSHRAGQVSGQSRRGLKATANRISKSVLRIQQRIRGKLSESDGVLRDIDSYADDYVLKGIQPGQRIEVRLKAKQFNGYLQLLNAKTGRELLYGDDISDSPRLREQKNPRMLFTAKAGVRYAVRVSSYESRGVGTYTLRTGSMAPSNTAFDFFYGHGLVGAAAAVSRATGQTLFGDVPELGGDNWGADLIKAPEVWAQGLTGQGVTVAVIDSGIDYNHPDLQENIWTNTNEIPNNGIDDDGNGYVDDIRGWNFVSNTNDPADDTIDGHGTHVSGTIAAARNDVGVTGVAYNAKIMPLKVLNRRSTAESDLVIAQAIRYAVDNGAKVINMSLGGDPTSGVEPELEEALKFARESGVVVVIASGNERQYLGARQSGDPAFYASVRDLAMIAGAVDINRQLYIDSNPAGTIPVDFVVAPGVEVTSTIPGATYATYEGTSMATPHVAGVAALMLSANPDLTPEQIETILTSTANPEGITPSP